VFTPDERSSIPRIARPAHRDKNLVFDFPSLSIKRGASCARALTLGKKSSCTASTQAAQTHARKAFAAPFHPPSGVLLKRQIRA
jgi:hypothetical protein